MGMLHKCMFRLVLVPFGLLLMDAQTASAEFKDPLDEPAVIQQSFLDKPLIGSASSGSTVVAVGPRGLILYSDNAGKTWSQANVPIQSDLVAAQMISDSQGWVVGHDGAILSTADGGASWIKQLDGRAAGKLFLAYYENLLAEGEDVEKAVELVELNYRDGPALPFLDVWFKNENIGYVVGAFGNIASTEDGGKTWAPWAHKIDNDAGYHLNSVQGIGNEVFIGSERGVLFRLDPEMLYFESFDTGYSGSFTGVAGLEELRIAYGLQGTAFVQDDSGDLWEPVVGLPASTINDLLVLAGGQEVLMANQAGELILGDVEMKEFRIVDSGEAVHFTSVVQVSENDVLITSLQGLYKMSLLDDAITRIAAEE